MSASSILPVRTDNAVGALRFGSGKSHARPESEAPAVGAAHRLVVVTEEGWRNPLSPSQSARRCGQVLMLVSFERLPRLNPCPPRA